MNKWIIIWNILLSNNCQGNNNHFLKPVEKTHVLRNITGIKFRNGMKTNGFHNSTLLWLLKHVETGNCIFIWKYPCVSDWIGGQVEVVRSIHRVYVTTHSISLTSRPPPPSWRPLITRWSSNKGRVIGTFNKELFSCWLVCSKLIYIFDLDMTFYTKSTTKNDCSQNLCFRFCNFFKTIYTPTKVNFFTNNKDQFPSANVFYRFCCSGYSVKYIGKTDTTTKDSAIYNHLVSCAELNNINDMMHYGIELSDNEQRDSQINCVENNVKEIDSSTNWNILLLKEALYIKRLEICFYFYNYFGYSLDNCFLTVHFFWHPLMFFKPTFIAKLAEPFCCDISLDQRAYKFSIPRGYIDCRYS